MMYTLRNQCMLCAIHVYAEKSVNTINTMRLLLKKFTIFLLQSACLIAQARSNGAETRKTAKYVGFEPYWGWSNQILELKAMAAMAKHFNTTGLNCRALRFTPSVKWWILLTSSLINDAVFGGIQG